MYRSLRGPVAWLLIVLLIAGVGLANPGRVSATAITFVQGNAHTGSGSVLSTAYPVNVAAGHLLVGIFRTKGNPAVTDNLNGAWTKAASNRYASIWYRPSTRPGLTRVTLTATSGLLRASIAEYSGISPFITFISGACTGGRGSAVRTGNTAAVPAGDLVFAGVTTYAFPATITAGVTNGVPAALRRSSSTSYGAIAAEDVTAAAAGIQNASMTLSTATTVYWNACIAVFRAGHNYYWGATIGAQFTGTFAPEDWWTGKTDCTTTATSCSDFGRKNTNGKPLSLIHVVRTWPSVFPVIAVTHVRGDGVIPMIDWASGGVSDNAGTQSITSGYWDSYITAWAQAAARWGHPFFLRFDWEMNGKWFDWGVGHNGTTAADYVAAWRHVHDIFTRVGGVKASWVWCPNRDPGGVFAPLFPSWGVSLYPGDSYVDWTGIDGYNVGGTLWTGFTGLFQATYNIITQHVPSKPMVLAEVGSTAYGANVTNGGKGRWISDMFVALATTFPNVYGLSWFDHCGFGGGPGGRSDWPLEVSVSATEGSCTALTGTPASLAFARGVAATNYKSNSYSGLTTSPIPKP